MSFAPAQTGSLAPGLYGSVTVNATAAVTLTAGTYMFASLDLEPQGVLNLDTSAGAIWLYVNGSVIWRGGVAGVRPAEDERQHEQRDRGERTETTEELLGAAEDNHGTVVYFDAGHPFRSMKGPPAREG